LKRHLSMILDITDILFSFTVFSMLGWVLELLYRSIRDQRFVNPGLLKGPYLILSGCMKDRDYMVSGTTILRFKMPGR